MESIFDGMKSYTSEWVELDSRAFNEKEQSQIANAVVKQADYGKSVCFTMVSGKMHYIPLEKSCSHFGIGEELNVQDMKVVSLEYKGSDPAMKVTKITRIRVEAKEADFDNPFGL